MVELRRLAEENRPPEWIYTDFDRCHICGCVFEDGDEFNWTHGIETYSIAGGKHERPMNVQWHAECEVRIKN
jgi:hypothetical protein